jgi:formylglycine-generating enzyme required for sulfatase activity
MPHFRTTATGLVFKAFLFLMQVLSGNTRAMPASMKFTRRTFSLPERIQSIQDAISLDPLEQTLPNRLMPITPFLHCVIALIVCLSWTARLEANDSPNSSTMATPSRSILESVQAHLLFVGSRNDAPMALIPAGEFAMGSDRGQDDEQPVHRVSVKPFYLDAHEVTVSHYREFLSSQKVDPPFKWNDASTGSHDGKPVIGVNWYDARDYCRWVGKRLPTEAEWEMAARGIEGRTYPWGNAHPTKAHANAGQSKWRGYDTLSNVGRYELGKTPEGVYDLAGNLWEWVADWYDPVYYQFSPRDNPSGPPAGPLRAMRGGAWNNDSKTIRSTNRAGYAPDARRNDLGFRCARDAKSTGR